MAIEIIDANLTGRDEYLRTLPPGSPQYEYDAFFIDHDRAMFEAEKRWIEEVVRRLPDVQTGPPIEEPSGGS